MDVIISQKPGSKGRVNISATLNSMELGEVWTVDTTEISLTTMRGIHSYVSLKYGKKFSISNTAEMGTTMTVTRTK